MKGKKIIEYISSNVENISINLHFVFGLNTEQIKDLILNLAKAFKYNENLANKNQSLEVFSFENCKKLKKELLNLGLSSDTIGKVIVKSPVILLYSNQLDSVYYLFKNKKYCGYTILDDDKYVTYLLNENIKSNVISNNYVTDNMLKYYKVNDYKKEVFDSLESQFKLKNYYFKKKSVKR